MFSRRELMPVIIGILISFTTLSIVAAGVYSQRNAPATKSFRLL